MIADIDRPLSWRRVMAIGLIGSYAMSVRVIGVAIVPAVLLLALVRPRDRTRLLALCGTWLLLGLTAILVVGIDRVPFLRLALRGPGVLFGRLAAFWPKYQYSVFESLLYPTPWDVVNDAYHVAVLAIIPLGLYVFVRRFGRSALGCLSVTYLAIAMLAPVADLRYLWPLWPVLAYSLFAGLRLAASWIPRWSTRLTRLLPAGAALLLVGTVISALQAEPRASLLNRAEVQDLFTWIREAKSREPMRVLFISPRVLTLETGVPAMGFFNARPENIVSEFERVRITHVIIGDAGTSHPSTDGLHELMRERAASFDRQYANAEFTVYRVHDLSPPPGI